MTAATEVDAAVAAGSRIDGGRDVASAAEGVPVVIAESTSEDLVIEGREMLPADAGDAPATHVSRATYPLAPSLAKRLYQSSLDAEQAQAQLDASAAVRELLTNAVTALDRRYFCVSGEIRSAPWFQHNLCIRVSADPDLQQLTITDCGSGMTRADLINVLGVARGNGNGESENDGDGGDESSDESKLGQNQRKGEKVNNGRYTTKNTPHSESKDDWSLSTTDSSSNEDGEDGDEEEAEAESEDRQSESENDSESESVKGNEKNEQAEGEMDSKNRKQVKACDPCSEMIAGGGPAHGLKKRPLSCLPENIGGFYAAVCALGSGVRVGTKSKFDEYYEFQVGRVRSSTEERELEVEQEGPSTFYDHFVITRPYDEGAEISADMGHDGFTDVRGESGTKITIQLRPSQFGLLHEESTLLPMMAQIMEQITTQYSFLSSSAPDAQELIDASAIETDERRRLREAKAAQIERDDIDANRTDGEGENEGEDRFAHSAAPHKSVKERAKYIPLRLSLGERKMLRLVRAAMHCCDYTTQVDRPFRNPARRMHQQLKSLTAILRGLVTACDFEAGRKLADDYEDESDAEDSDDEGPGRHWKKCEAYFQRVFELARRHKIANPESARTEYGKLIHLLQDAVSASIQPHLGVSVRAPIRTVYNFLEERDAINLLEDDHIDLATQEVLAGRKSRDEINIEIRRKERAVNILKQKYRSKDLSSEDIHLCLYSICDNTSFLNSNSVPIDKMISFMQEYFSPHQVEEGYSLSIVSGQDGARLSHSHERQYYFALQTLILWRDIIEDMFRLWAMMEADMMSETVPYRLQDTGQGLQRVQQSPRTYQAMQQILVRVQQQVDQWVGSSVIHLGDHNVPNALSFIDKYTQVPRILGPIVACLEQVEKICDEDEGVREMIDEGFGGMHQLRKDILYDFLRSAFDGSGADNFYDAGSCIDGRLTSAWNWCSQLPDKPFYPIFKLTGFIGFDGEFK